MLLTAYYGGAVTGAPGTVIGALGFGVCSLVEGVIRLPFDIAHAFKSANPEMPVNLPKKAFCKLFQYAQALLDTMTLLFDKQMLLVDALKELHLQAEYLDKNKLNSVFRKRSLHVQPAIRS